MGGRNIATLGFRAVTGMVLVGALFSSTSYARQACDRACLTKVIDGYFAALVANDSTKLPQAAKARITENGAERKLAQTFWDSAAEVVYGDGRRSTRGRALRDPERLIREIHAVLFNMPDAMPTGWPTTDYGPGRASAE